MNILMVSSFLPYPLYSGGHIRLYNLIRELTRKHNITLIAEKRPQQTKKDIAALEKFCKRVITVNRKKQWTVHNILQTGFSHTSFLVTGHTLPAMREAIADVITKEKFDVIHVETSYIFQNVPSTDVPILLVEHNVEYLVYERFVSRAPLVLRPLLSADVAKLRRQEEQFWQQATGIAAVSAKEQHIIASFAKQAFLIPNGVDLQTFHYQKRDIKTERKILFIGDFSWVQNRDAAIWIIKDIWPLVRTLMPEEALTLWVVGRKIPESIKKLSSDPQIHFDEHAVGSAADIFSRADILLAPIRIGGGTQYKILEAMAVGTPVVTTSLGSEGLIVANNESILLADTAGALAKQVQRLVTDKVLYRQIARAGRTVIEKKYAWDTIAHELEGAYKTVITHEK